MSQDTSSSVDEVLDTLDKLAEGEDEVTVSDVTEAFGGRGFGPLMLLPALMVVTPLGGLPTFPTLMAIVIALFAVQLILQREQLWLPSVLEERAVDDERVKKASSKLRPLARWIDKRSGERLTFLTESPAPALAAALILALCLSVPFAELIPFAAILPMAAIAVLALALMVRDGIWMVCGLLGAGLALCGLWYLSG